MGSEPNAFDLVLTPTSSTPAAAQPATPTTNLLGKKRPALYKGSLYKPNNPLTKTTTLKPVVIKKINLYNPHGGSGRPRLIPVPPQAQPLALPRPTLQVIPKVATRPGAYVPLFNNPAPVGPIIESIPVEGSLVAEIPVETSLTTSQQGLGGNLTPQALNILNERPRTNAGKLFILQLCLLQVLQRVN